MVMTEGEFTKSIETRLKAVMGPVMYRRAVELFEEVLEGDYSVIVTMARSCYDLFRALRPVLKDRFGNKFYKVTNDKMIVPWLNSNAGEITSVAVVDDIIMAGQGSSDCVQRLQNLYGLRDAEYTVFAMYIRKQDDPAVWQKLSAVEDHEDETYIKVHSQHSAENQKPVPLRCVDRERYTDAFLRERSLLMIKALHGVSQAYVAYMPVFAVKLENISDLLFKNTLLPGKSVSPDDISDIFSDWTMKNITTKPQSDVGVDAFALYPPNGKLKGQPDSKVTAVTAIRVYINHNPDFGRVLIVPYISLKDYTPAAISDDKLPQAIANLVKKPNSAAIEERPWKEEDETRRFPYRQAVNRLVRFAAGYYMGIDFLAMLGITEGTEDLLVEKAGIDGAKEYFDFLQGNNPDWLKTVSEAVGENMMDTNKFDEKYSPKLTKVLRRYANAMRGANEDGFFLGISNAWIEFTNTITNTLRNDNPNLLKFRPKSELYGIPLSSFRRCIEEVFGTQSNEDFYALIFKLCDCGYAVTQIACVAGVMHTVIRHGETLFQATGSIIAESGAGFSGYAYGLTMAMRMKQEYLELYRKHSAQYADQNDKLSVLLKTVIGGESGAELGVSRSINSAYGVDDNDFFLQLAMSLSVSAVMDDDEESYIQAIKDDCRETYPAVYDYFEKITKE